MRGYVAWNLDNELEEGGEKDGQQEGDPED